MPKPVARHAPSTESVPDAARPLPAPPAAVARAVGMVMAVTPCPAREALRILEAAADLAHVTVEFLAAVMTARTADAPLPVHLDRAVRHAIEAARTPAPPTAARPAALTPSPTRTEEVLTRLRGCQARLAAQPGDPGAVRAMDDAAYVLCVLMGRPVTHEAVLAAEEQLAAHDW